MRGVGRRVNNNFFLPLWTFFFCLYFGIQRMRRDLAYFVIKDLMGFHPNAILMINHRFCDLVHFYSFRPFSIFSLLNWRCVQLDL